MIKDIAIEKMKSASNYVITFLKWALISIIIGVVGGCVGALISYECKLCEYYFYNARLVCTVSSDRRYYNRGNVQSV